MQLSRAREFGKADCHLSVVVVNNKIEGLNRLNEQVIDVGTKPETGITLGAPFVEWSKTDIVERGLELDVPYDHTWSCYRAEEPACGTCDSCAFRLQAFQRAGVEDPIAYAERPVYNE